MSQPASSDSYVFDRNQTDHDRLIRQAGLNELWAREACQRAGLRPGGRAIDVGCGPLGALPVLAEAVGRTGTAVGLDASAASLAQARQVLDGLGLEHVRLIQADISTVTPAEVAPHGPFDLAYCRFVLMYQPDPARALRQVATLLRPGSRIVAVDLLPDSSYPAFDPPVPAVGRVLAFFSAAAERRGGMVDVARRYPEVCAQAGLLLREQRSWAAVPPAAPLLLLYRDILFSMRSMLLTIGLATETEISTLAREIEEAVPAVRFGITTVQIEMIAEVPE